MDDSATRASTSTRLVIPVLACSWRDQAFIEKFLSSLEAAAVEANVEVRLYILENGPGGKSSSSTIKAYVSSVQSKHLHVIQKFSEKNIGISGGMNTLFQFCMADKNHGVNMGAHVFVANTDVEFKKDFFAAYKNTLPQTEKNPLVCNVFYSKYSGKFTGTKRLAIYMRQEPTGKVPVKITPTFSGDGAVLAIPFSITSLRSPPGIYSLEDVYTSEDVELFFWFRDIARTLLFVPTMQLDHFGSGSFGTPHFRERSLALQYAKVCSWRAIVRKYRRPQEFFGYCLGESSFLYAFLRAHGSHGLRLFLSSFKHTSNLLAADPELDIPY